MCVGTCAHACMCTYRNTSVSTCVHLCMSTHTGMSLYPHVYPYVYIHLHACIPYTCQCTLCCAYACACAQYPQVHWPGVAQATPTQAVTAGQEPAQACHEVGSVGSRKPLSAPQAGCKGRPCPPAGLQVASPNHRACAPTWTRAGGRRPTANCHRHGVGRGRATFHNVPRGRNLAEEVPRPPAPAGIAVPCRTSPCPWGLAGRGSQSARRERHRAHQSLSLQGTGLKWLGGVRKGVFHSRVGMHTCVRTRFH